MGDIELQKIKEELINLYLKIKIHKKTHVTKKYFKINLNHIVRYRKIKKRNRKRKNLFKKKKFNRNIKLYNYFNRYFINLKSR